MNSPRSFFVSDIARFARDAKDVVKLRKAPGLPDQIHVSVTDRCTLPCRMCDIWKIKPGPELTTNEWKGVFDQIADWAGPVGLNFAGGEPFLRKDLFEKPIKSDLEWALKDKDLESLRRNTQYADFWREVREAAK